MRVTNLILNVMSLLLVVVGIGLTSTFFFPLFFSGPTASSSAPIAPPEEFNVPVLTTPENTTSEEASPEITSQSQEEQQTTETNEVAKSPGNETANSEKASRNKPAQNRAKKQKEEKTVPVPEDKTLWVTVPKMNRIQDSAIPSTRGDDEASLKEYAGIHLEGTGFPWQEEANVYIAGHRLGYPTTDSFLAFWDLDKVGKGDEVYVKDSMGRSYTYRVFKEFVVNPGDIFVTQPEKGKNIITLQTCTLPDYSQRLIIQAEKVA